VSGLRRSPCRPRRNAHAASRISPEPCPRRRKTGEPELDGKPVFQKAGRASTPEERTHLTRRESTSPRHCLDDTRVVPISGESLLVGEVVERTAAKVSGPSPLRWTACYVAILSSKEQLTVVFTTFKGTVCGNLNLMGVCGCVCFVPW
jgi:hypothetical protein